MLGMPVGPRPTAPAASGYTAVPAQQYSTAQTAAPDKNEAPIKGTAVPGGSLAEKLDWLDRSADSHNTYIVEVNANESIAPHTLEYAGAINITIYLKGDAKNRTVRLSTDGTMFTVRTNVTFILENNITLQGNYYWKYLYP